MQTIGEFLKEARIKKKISIKRLAKITKIKKEYIQAIEECRWENLPEKAVVSGFIDSISKVLNLSRSKQRALFRRDYPLKPVNINPKPDVERRFVWTPKSTFLLGVSIVVILILAYLTSQYINFIKPPLLQLELPKEGEVIKTSKVLVKGKTSPDTSLVVNNQPVIVSQDGEFETEIEVFKDTQDLLVIAKSRSGKETSIRRKINLQLED